MNFDKEVDARGLNCPLPILRKEGLAEMQAGQQVLRVADRSRFGKRIFGVARQTGNELLARRTAGRRHEFFPRTKCKADAEAVNTKGPHALRGPFVGCAVVQAGGSLLSCCLSLSRWR